ncbi:MAG: hypothetical protein WC333_02015 [Dehalococcoidia bacterium]|jgi:hypothetical protein
MVNIKQSGDVYLLFGTQAVKAYEENNIKAAVKIVKDDNGAAYHWNSNHDTPMSLINNINDLSDRYKDSDNCDEYTEITKEEYELFQ